MKKTLFTSCLSWFLFVCVSVLGDVVALSDGYKASLADSYRLENEQRRTYSLNGVWKIGLTEVITEQPPAAEDFGFVVVPSSWMNSTEFPITGNDGFESGSWSGTNQWKGKKFAEYPSAWYVREFDSPEVADDEEVFLKLDRVTISGTVLLNGQEVGRLSEREDVRWNVTDILNRDGQANILQVRVDALLSKSVKAYLGGDETVMIKAKAQLRGITGDVWLQVEPAGPTLQNIFITTSTRQNTITFAAEISGGASSGGPVDFVVDVFDKASGEKVKTFQKTLSALPAVGQSISMTHAWADATLWDTDQPHLYTAVASLQSGARDLDTTFPETFGFREVWIEGRDIVLNGKPLHLFSYHAHAHDTFVNAARKVAEAEMDAMTAIGFNSIQLGSEGTSSDGRSAQYYQDVLELTDAKGLPVIMPIYPVYAYGWEDPEQQERWTEHMQALVKRYRNHPSLLVYGMNFNYLGYGWDMNPHTWASGYQPPDTINNLGNKRVHADDSVARLKLIDESRLVYNHASGNYGDFITSNFYPCWPPLQELGDSLSGWAQTGTKPMIFVELSLPVYILDLMRARQGNYMDVRYSEVLEAEYLSETLGAEAYALQSDTYLQLISDGATREKKAGSDKYNVNQSYIWNYALRLHEPLTTGILAMRPSFFKDWRSYGLTGFSPNNRRFMEYYGRQFEPWQGPKVNFEYDDLTAPGPKPFTHHIPQDLEITLVGMMTQKYLRPVLIYFGGDAEEGVSSKDHAWFSGDQIHKQLVVVNDARQHLSSMVQWRMVDLSNEQSVAEGEVKVKVSAGTVASFDVRLKAPEVESRRAYRLEATWSGPLAEQTYVESFSLEVFPEMALAPSVLKTTIGLFDPTGNTRQVFDQLGLSYVEVKAGEPLPDCQVYVVGQDVLSVETHIPPEILIQVIEQGRSLVCFEQRNLQDFGLRMHARGERTVFPVDRQHPVLKGLQTEDLRQWRGAFSLSEAYPKDRLETPGQYPEEFWKWGNRGVVSSYMIEKPATGPLLSILESGFDLQYTPLAELREGKGTVLLCQLDVTERVGVDPAATSIFQQLLTYASTLHPRSLKQVTLSGKLTEDSLLKSAVDESIQRDQEIVLHAGPISAVQKTEFEAVTQKGGTVILMGAEALRTSGFPLADPETYFRATPLDQTSLARGISNADTFIKDQRRDAFPKIEEGVIALTEPPVISMKQEGAGAYILVAIDPIDYRDSDITPERSKRIYGKVLRMVSVMTTQRDGALTPLSQNYLDGFSTARLDLPGKWKFSIDLNNKGAREKWFSSEFDDEAWQMLSVPGLWENQGITTVNPRFADSKRPYDGFAWYRCEVIIPENMIGQGDLYLTLGAVDDMDTTYFNGERIGMTGKETENAYAVIRRYRIPAELIQAGQLNTIAVRVYDTLGGGGMTGPELYIDRGDVDPYPYMFTEPMFNPYKLKRW
ncbi:hypothetical protein P3T73_04245 [Kiritimatiellota bacterium B12222]|nr:hypothetical protein P3T73_04245 [Kiritimatiellota bacterium B12222]